MKVFACKCQRSFASGLLLVAANTREEAFTTAVKNDKDGWYFDIEDGKVDSGIFPFDKWYEVDDLSANVSEPKVIVEQFYSE